MKKKTKKTKNSSKRIKKNPKLILVNKNMTFGEILNRYPAAGEIILSKGLHCIGCGMAMYESLEQGAIMHGINPDKLVKEINKKIGKKK